MASDMRLNDKPIAKDGAYIYAEAADGSQVKISKADLATVVAGIIGISNFYGGLVLGTLKNSVVEIAKEVINALPFGEGTFVVRHKYAGERLVYGFVYGSKLYGSITIQQFEGSTRTVDLKDNVYTERI